MLEKICRLAAWTPPPPSGFLSRALDDETPPLGSKNPVSRQGHQKCQRGRWAKKWNMKMNKCEKSQD